MGYGEMVTITQSLSDEAIAILADDFKRQVEIVHAQDEAEEGEEAFVDEAEDLKPRAAGRHRHGPRGPRQDEPAGRASARPTWPRARPAASRSTSAPTRSSYDDQQGDLPRHARPRGLHGHAGPRRQHDRHRRCWWWRPTTGSCRRRSRPSTTPRPPRCRSSWPSTRSTCPAPTCNRSLGAALRARPGARASGAATPTWSRPAPRTGQGIDDLLEMLSTTWPSCSSSRPTTRPGDRLGRRGRRSTQPQGPWPRCWSRKAGSTKGDVVLAGDAYGRVRTMRDS